MFLRKRLNALNFHDIPVPLSSEMFNVTELAYIIVKRKYYSYAEVGVYIGGCVWVRNVICFGSVSA